jgi:sarcosine oxidase / L-pipecolate oxidase
VQATVTSLTFDQSGNCTGVETADGRKLTASHTILATGAETVQLLADCAQGRADLLVENKLLAAGVVTNLVPLSHAQRRHFDTLPTVVHDVENIYGLDFLWLARSTTCAVR